MKSNFIILLFCSTCFFTSCKKREFHYGNAQLILNNQFFSGDILTYSNGFKAANGRGFTIYNEIKNKNNFSHKSFTFSYINTSDSQYFQNCNASQDTNCLCTASFYYLTHEEYGGDIFRIDTNALKFNYLLINKQTNNYKEIEGEFQMRMIRVINLENNSIYPDTINITNGKFHLFFE